jgi:hypothetical protein
MRGEKIDANRLGLLPEDTERAFPSALVVRD